MLIMATIILQSFEKNLFDQKNIKRWLKQCSIVVQNGIDPSELITLSCGHETCSYFVTCAENQINEISLLKCAKCENIIIDNFVEFYSLSNTTLFEYIELINSRRRINTNK